MLEISDWSPDLVKIMILGIVAQSWDISRIHGLKDYCTSISLTQDMIHV
jgi:hypothetical protein